MDDNTKKRNVELLNEKLDKFYAVDRCHVPSGGWLKKIRITLQMSLRQMGIQQGYISPTAVQRREQGEANNTITLGTLERFGEAFNLKLVYGFIPKQTLQNTVKDQAKFIAKTIVDDPRDIEDKQTELIFNMPKILWDKTK